MLLLAFSNADCISEKPGNDDVILLMFTLSPDVIESLTLLIADPAADNPLANPESERTLLADLVNEVAAPPKSKLGML